MLLHSSLSQEDHPIQNRPLLPHILPALCALLIMVGAIMYIDRYMCSVEDKYIHGLAPLNLPQSWAGSVLQQATFRQPDLLPVYGSSEMLSKPASSLQASNLFSSYPTGFAIFNISENGLNPLDIAQSLAALGPELKNKKVVISFTPTLFDRAGIKSDDYDSNYSRMHAYALAFSPNLSMALKQRIAKRMLDYPETLRHDMVLTMAVRNLSSDGLASHLKYALIFPLGLLESLIMRMQDHYAVWDYIQHNPKINLVPSHRSQPIDWAAALAQAEAEQQIATSNNPYGIENNVWVDKYHQTIVIRPAGSGDKNYLSLIETSNQWVNFDLVLGIFKEMGATPLILSRPMNGLLYTTGGVSPQAQQVYYTKLESLVRGYNFPLADFKEYTNDRLFSIDYSSHTSLKGWVIVDQTLDAFYHGNIH